MINTDKDSQEIVACSSCFYDQGLHLDAEKMGITKNVVCPYCGDKNGKKLTLRQLDELAYRFFVRGSIIKCKYGCFPAFQYNTSQETSISLNPNLINDVNIFEKMLGVGFFDYGPRAWMYGENEPLIGLCDKKDRGKIISRIIKEYPEYIVSLKDFPIYKIRNDKNVKDRAEEFDSAPEICLGNGRFDSAGHPVLYASTDLELCIHEARATVEDELYVGTLVPTTSLRLLDLTPILREGKEVTGFESLDIAMNMIFLAGKNSYDITQEISIAAENAGFDGIVYPSHFSYIRNGESPYRSFLYGISNRLIPEFQKTEEDIIAKNFAFFGRPILEKK